MGERTLEVNTEDIDDVFLNHIREVNTQPRINALEEADLTMPEYTRICRKCRDATSLETPYHYYTECPAVLETRRDHLKSYLMYETHPQWSPRSFVDFFKTLDLEN